MKTRCAALAAICLTLCATCGAALASGPAAAPAAAQSQPQPPQPLAPAPAPAEPPLEVRAPEVVIPASMMLPAPESLKSLFPQGFFPGLGFGVSTIQAQQDGSLVLLTLSGRGPTVPGPAVPAPDGQTASAIFILPAYTPSIVTLKLAGARAEVIGVLPIKDEDGKPMRGLPPPTAKNAAQPVPLSLSLARLQPDPKGVDPQGIAYDPKRGVYWLTDGYRPAVLRISARDGRVLALDGPENTFEPFLATHRPGWGFAGASVSPPGKLYTIMRGPLFWEGKPAIVSRIIEFDPDTERVRQLAYPLDLETFADPAQLATSDIVAVADKRVLVLEQGLDKDGKPRSLVFAADLTQAHNINRVFNEAGQPAEAMRDGAQWRKADLRPARKTLVLDLQAAGFPGARAESMTLLADGRTLAFMSGQGFGLEAQMTGYEKDSQGQPVLSLPSYQLQENGTLSYQGKPSGAAVGIRPAKDTAHMWMALLPKKVTEY